MTSQGSAVSPSDKEKGNDVSAEEQVVQVNEGCESNDVNMGAAESERIDGLAEGSPSTGEDGREHPDEFMCKVCGDSEAEAIKTVRSPGKPSAKDVEEHNLTHCPYRSWCDACVKGQAKDDGHRAVTGELEEGTGGSPPQAGITRASARSASRRTDETGSKRVMVWAPRVSRLDHLSTPLPARAALDAKTDSLLETKVQQVAVPEK